MHELDTLHNTNSKLHHGLPNPLNKKRKQYDKLYHSSFYHHKTNNHGTCNNILLHRNITPALTCLQYALITNTLEITQCCPPHE